MPEGIRAALCMARGIAYRRGAAAASPVYLVRTGGWLRTSRNVPWALAAIHSGALLVKLLPAAIIVGGWPRHRLGEQRRANSTPAVASPLSPEARVEQDVR
jgi:hypothetical protein